MFISSSSSSSSNKNTRKLLNAIKKEAKTDKTFL
jgi:multimeric flavodoxin WrbA